LLAASAPLQDADCDGDVTGAVTVTVPDAVFVESALLMAVTVSVPAFVDAVYIPVELTVPDVAIHLTVLSVTLP
jgi:hypothetical protein